MRGKLAEPFRAEEQRCRNEDEPEAPADVSGCGAAR